MHAREAAKMVPADSNNILFYYYLASIPLYRPNTVILMWTK